jgi:hypothetical protein
VTFNFLRGPTSGHLDVSRMMWALGGLVGMGLAGAHLFINHQFSIGEFWGGLGVFCAGGGVATAIKDGAVAKAVATAPSGDAA